MVLLFLFFGYQKWFEYEAQGLIPYISNGPLISWMYPMFGIRGASWFLGVSEWSSAVLLFLGFWYKRLGILGALGSCGAFLGTESAENSQSLVPDRKSTRLNSSHLVISYAVFCLKKKK